MRPEPKLPSGPSTGEKQIRTVTLVLGTFWIGLLFLFGFATEFDSSVVDSKGEMGSLYVYYQQVATMVLVGFGFLYAFLRKYPYGKTLRSFCFCRHNSRNSSNRILCA